MRVSLLLCLLLSGCFPTETQSCESSSDCNPGMFCLKPGIPGTRGACYAVGASAIVPAIVSMSCSHPNPQAYSRYEMRGSKMMLEKGGREYDCVMVQPMAKRKCPDCGAFLTDLADGPAREEGAECNEFNRDEAALCTPH